VGAILAGAYLARLEAKRRSEDPDHLGNLLMWCLILGLIGARLYHVLSTPQGASRDFSYYFVEQPFAALTFAGLTVPFPTALFIWEGGMGLLGAIGGGVLGLLIYTRRHRLNSWRWLDIATPSLLLGQTIGRWGNFFNQELYGTPTIWPWGITISNVNQRLAPYNDLTIYPLETSFHPLFLYESLWTLLGLLILLRLSRKYAARLPEGDIFALYLLWYGLGRLAIEALRPDAWLLFGIPVAQMVSVLFMLVGMGLLYYRHRYFPSSNKVGPEEN
jgi:phosphatidylglycerol:prolipoprotein diacylglycerol transferase